MNSRTEREELFGERAGVLEGAKVFGLRYRPGDDASCNNLYQATQPRIIGVTPAFIERYDDAAATAFSFAASRAPE